MRSFISRGLIQQRRGGVKTAAARAVDDSRGNVGEMEDQIRSKRFDLIEIGTGAAGSTVAFKCRAACWNVTIIGSKPGLFWGTSRDLAVIVFSLLQ
jgi:hypothetical protein